MYRMVIDVPKYAKEIFWLYAIATENCGILWSIANVIITNAVHIQNKKPLTTEDIQNMIKYL